METPTKMSPIAETTPATTISELEYTKDKVKDLARSFFVSKRLEYAQGEQTKEAIADLLLFEFEQVAERSKNRMIAPKKGVKEFVLRDCGETRADERFHLEYDEKGTIQHAICETDFGFEQDPPCRVTVTGDGEFSVETRIYHYNDGYPKFQWQPLSGEGARWVMDGFMEQTTSSLNKYYERLETDDTTLEAADASAQSIAHRLVNDHGTVLFMHY